MLTAHQRQLLEKTGVAKVSAMLAKAHTDLTKYPAWAQPDVFLFGLPEATVVAWLKEKAPPAPGLTLLYTDGGCQLTHDVGAWAWRADLPSGKSQARGQAQFGATNTRMELMAVIDALERLEIGPPIKLVADSDYVLKGMQIWLDKWPAKGWKNYSGGPVANLDLWQRLAPLRGLHQLTYAPVAGQSHPQNEWICTNLMDEFVKQSKLKKPVSIVEWESLL